MVLAREESDWKRGFRDFRDRVGSLSFWVGEIVAGTLVGAIYQSWYAAGLAVLGLAFLVWFITTLTTPIRQRNNAQKRIANLEAQLKPKLQLTFEPSDPGFLNDIRADVGQIRTTARFLRVQARNRGHRPISNCSVWLVGVEELVNQEFVETDYCDPQILAWGTAPTGDQFATISLLDGIPQFISVLHVNDVRQKIELSVKSQKTRYEQLFERHGTYRLTLRSSSDNGGRPEVIRLVVEWQGPRETLVATLGD